MLEDKKIESLIENYNQQKQIDTAAGWERVHKRIVADKRRRIIFNYARNAAAILLPLMLLFQYVVNPILENRRLEGETITISSATGIVTKAILPDGSEVWLNSQSTLTYPQRFTKKHRTVNLSGEAFFSVVSDKKNRFEVITPQDVVVSAYGTEFNVSTYANDPNCEVSLAKGHVEITTKALGEPQPLNVDEKAIYDKQSGKIAIHPTDTYVDTAWKDGKMIFRRAKLDQIADKLSKKFGVSFTLEDEGLKEYEYTATFVDESLEDILELLGMSAPITYTIQKQEQLDNDTFTHKEVIIKMN